MNKFNKLYITDDNPYKRFVLTQQGEAYFRKYFPITDNDTIAQNLGCSKRAVVKFAQTLGIKMLHISVNVADTLQNAYHNVILKNSSLAAENSIRRKSGRK